MAAYCRGAEDGVYYIVDCILFHYVKRPYNYRDYVGCLFAKCEARFWLWFLHILRSVTKNLSN